MSVTTPIENALRAHPLLALAIALILPLTACDKAKPAVKPAASASKGHAATAAPKRQPTTVEDREYSHMPTGQTTFADSVPLLDKAFEAEALRGGPNGEPRIFDNPQEKAELSRGSSPKYMNGQFRYYLVGVALAEPAQTGCRKPLLAIRLAVENLHGQATSAIYGRFSFTGDVGSGGVPQRRIAAPVQADIVGPFSEQRGGVVYVTAYAEQADRVNDERRWRQIADASPSQLGVWFTPEVFYYPDGTQYAARSGNGPAARTVMTCGGTEGATLAFSPR
jgi:hypothetical protein